MNDEFNVGDLVDAKRVDGDSFTRFRGVVYAAEEADTGIVRLKVRAPGGQHPSIEWLRMLGFGFRIIEKAHANLPYFPGSAVAVYRAGRQAIPHVAVLNHGGTWSISTGEQVADLIEWANGADILLLKAVPDGERRLSDEAAVSA